MSAHHIHTTGKKNNAWLTLLDQIIGDHTRQFIKENGLQAGMTVLDIGCGTGIITRWLAEQVGPTGHVYAVDAAAEKVEATQEYCTQNGLSNVTGIVADVGETGLPSKSIDIIFGRCILIHIDTVTKVLKHLHSLLKKEGVLLSDEPLRGSLQLEPAHPALDTLNADLAATIRATGRNPHIPLLFKEKFTEAHFAVEKHSISTNKVVLSQIQQLVTLGTAQNKSEIIEKCAAEVRALTAEKHPQGYWAQIHTVGRKQ